MCMYLQFDSLARKDAFVPSAGVNGPKLGPVALATAAILPNAPVYASPSQTLTQTGAPAALLVDTLPVTIGMRILVKDQADPRENGIYTVLTDNPWQLVRSPDFKQVSMPLPAGTTVAVTGGVANIGTAWSLAARVTLVDPLTDAVTWVALTWTPNSASTPTDYKVSYTNFNTVVNTITKDWREHCKQVNGILSFYAEFCVVTVPGCAYINRTNADGTVSRVFLTEEPYIYLDVYPTDHAEGNRFATNNDNGYKATFIAYTDKFAVGTSDVPPVSPAYAFPALNSGLKWLHFKSCMRTNMRMDLKSTQWHVRMYSRFGDDIVLEEDPALMPVVVTADMPPVDPNKQTSLLIGMSPLRAGYEYSSVPPTTTSTYNY